MTIIEQFLNARKFGVPILGIETPDQAATIQALVKAVNGKNKEAVLTWDCVRGPMAANELGKQALSNLVSDPMELLNPTAMLSKSIELKERAILFMYNAHRFFDDPTVMQGIWNVRDPFKANNRSLVLLGPVLKMPVELERDIIILDEPLPTDEELGTIVRTVHEYAGVTAPKAERNAELVRAARGLAPFPAEQAVALSLTKEGADPKRLWELKRKMVEQTRGLQMYSGGDTFDSIGGIDRIKQFGNWLFRGPEAPALIVHIDEIEKQLSGISGDLSGTSQDQNGVLLQAMQDNNWKGLIAVGHPGCAKSMFAKALASSNGRPTIRLDLGAMKGSLVGQSEQQVRAALKIIRAVAGEHAYFVATCNKLEVLPPELRRRFTDGIWFFDLPDEDEREHIWSACLKRYKLMLQVGNKPDDTNWTGADINNVCSIAHRLNCTLKDAASFITPVAKSDPQSIERLRKLADGSFLSASYSGVYQREDKKPKSDGWKGDRKVEL